MEKKDSAKRQKNVHATVEQMKTILKEIEKQAKSDNRYMTFHAAKAIAEKAFDIMGQTAFDPE